MSIHERSHTGPPEPPYPAQLGNSSGKRFLSLHVYGRYDISDDDASGITDSTRIYDVCAGRVDFVNGGAFLALPPSAATNSVPGLKVGYAR